GGTHPGAERRTLKHGAVPDLARFLVLHSSRPPDAVVPGGIATPGVIREGYDMRSVYRYGQHAMFSASLLCCSALSALAQTAPAAPADAAPAAAAAAVKIDSGDT